ncbi:MAG: ORF6N domain-containing protein [Ignavibacteriales bacterium]|nr:ORF6N domain-containing protein [Ignavibacteriales bacterium]
MSLPIKIGTVAQLIRFIRGEKVILDRDIAQLYNIETRALKQAVKRNIKRFPRDFMFVLNKEEFISWRSQFVTSDSDRKGLRYAPMAFTEQGVAMLSSVLNSERAIEINIAIMRAFVKLRQLMESNKNLAKKIAALESKYDGQFQIVFEAIKQLMQEDNKHKDRIGF